MVTISAPASYRSRSASLISGRVSEGALVGRIRLKSARLSQRCAKTSGSVSKPDPDSQDSRKSQAPASRHRCPDRAYESCGWSRRTAMHPRRANAGDRRVAQPHGPDGLGNPFRLERLCAVTTSMMRTVQWIAPWARLTVCWTSSRPGSPSAAQRRSSTRAARQWRRPCSSPGRCKAKHGERNDNGRSAADRARPIRLGADPDHLTWVRWVWPRRIGSHVECAVPVRRANQTDGRRAHGRRWRTRDARRTRPPPNGTAPPASTPSGRLM